MGLLEFWRIPGLSPHPPQAHYSDSVISALLAVGQSYFHVYLQILSYSLLRKMESNSPPPESR